MFRAIFFYCNALMGRLAKRHPECDQGVTDYFIIDINKNARSVKAGVFGPFNEHEFINRRESLGVPESLGFSLNP